MEALLIVLGACWLIWRGLVATQVALDARQHRFTPQEIIGWSIVAVVDADRYWWGAQLDQLSVPEARELLVTAAQAHQLLSVVNVCCPLCDYEIKNALSVAADNKLVVRRQATCAHCDFRVDACRHCAHFQPATDTAPMSERHGDVSHGRCGFYRAVEPVRTAYPQHARHMEALGYDTLPTPKAIVDSYIPLMDCTAFSLEPDLLRNSRVPWIDRRRVALIRLHQRVNRSR